MVASVDGRTLTSRWRPEDPSRRELFEQLHERLAVDAWLIGRITGHTAVKSNERVPAGQAKAFEPAGGPRLLRLQFAIVIAPGNL
jgi:hypothetical protein